MSPSHQLSVRLDYQIHAGWLRPYLDGLTTGKTIAWRCQNCDRTTFPPRRRCACGAVEGQWVTLAGTGRVVAVTSGRAQTPFTAAARGDLCALVTVDGACNVAFGQVDAGNGDAARGMAVRLTATASPILVAWPAARFVPI